MKNELFIVSYESAHWCGGKSFAVVLALNETEAEYSPGLEDHMHATMSDLFEENEYADHTEYVINSIRKFDSNHKYWKDFLDKHQRENFYPCVGFVFEDLDIPESNT